MTQRTEIVVVGGGYAGVLAATRAAGAMGDRAHVSLVSPDDVMVERIRLHEHIVSDAPIAHPLSRFLEGTGVSHVKARAVGLDTKTRTLVLDTGTLRYDRLVVTVGSEAVMPELPGAEVNAYALSYAHADALRSEIRRVARTGGDVVVCGGGLTGVETATEIKEHHPTLRVTLLTSGEVGAMVSPRGRDHIRKVCARLGVVVREGVRVSAIEADHVVASGVRYDAHVCIWAGGFAVPKVVRALGLATNTSGRAIVDDGLRALGHEDVIVAGDAAEPVLAHRGVALPMGCKTALPQGVFAANAVVTSLNGRPSRAFAFVDSAFCISLGRHDALIQRLTPEGTCTDFVLTGRVAAFVKELVCRGTVGFLLASRGLFTAARSMVRPRPRMLLARAEPIP